MSDILERIVAVKRQEIEACRSSVSLRALESRLASAAAVRDFRAALEKGPDVGFIAEVKRASPSAGVLRENFDPLAIARVYEAHGAAAISVLTDAHFFQGSLAYLTGIRQAVAPPV